MEELTAKAEMRMNLSAVKRIDPEVEEIVSRAKQVALYDFNIIEEEWKVTEVIGVLFVCKRATEPYYSLVIMNRQNDENFIKPIIKQLEWQLYPPFLVYQSCQEIQGIWFFNQDECECITTLVTQIVECLQVIDQDQSKQVEIDKKMLTIVAKAQEDYFKSALASKSLPEYSIQPPAIEKSIGSPVKINRGEKNNLSVTQTVQNSASASKTVCSNPVPSDKAPLCTTPCQNPFPMHQSGVSTVTVVIDKNRQQRLREMRQKSKSPKDTATAFAAPASADHNVKAIIKSPSPFSNSIEYYNIFPALVAPHMYTNDDSTKSAFRKVDERSENITQFTPVHSVTSNVGNDDKNDNIKIKNSSSESSTSRKMNYSTAIIAYESPDQSDEENDNPLTTMVFNNTKRLERAFTFIPPRLRRATDAIQLKPNNSPAANVGTDYKKDSIKPKPKRRLTYAAEMQSNGKGSDSQPPTSQVINNSKHLENGFPTAPLRLKKGFSFIPPRLRRAEGNTQLKPYESPTSNVSTDEKKDVIKPTAPLRLKKGFSFIPPRLRRAEGNTQLIPYESPTSNVSTDEKKDVIKPTAPLRLKKGFSFIPPRLRRAEGNTQLIPYESPTSNVSTDEKKDVIKPTAPLRLKKGFSFIPPRLRRAEGNTQLKPYESPTSNVTTDDKRDVIKPKPKRAVARRLNSQPPTSQVINNSKHLENGFPTAPLRLKKGFSFIPPRLRRAEGNTQLKPYESPTSNVSTDDKKDVIKPKPKRMDKDNDNQPLTSEVFNNTKENAYPTIPPELKRTADVTQLSYSSTTAAPSNPSMENKSQGSNCRPSSSLGLYNPKHFENGCPTASLELKRSENKTLLIPVTSATSNVSNDNKNNSSLLKPLTSTQRIYSSVFTTRPSSFNQSKDKSIHCRPSSSLGLYNPKYFENNYQIVSSELKRSENKTQFTEITSALTSTEQNDSSTPENRSSSSKQSKDKGIRRRPSSSLGLSNPKYFEKSYTTAPSSPNELPDYRPGSIKEYFINNRAKGKSSRPSSSLGFTDPKDIENVHLIKAASSTDIQISDIPPGSFQEYCSTLHRNDKNATLTPTKLPDYRPGSNNEFFLEGTTESYLFNQCTRSQIIDEGNNQLAVPLKDDAADSATLKQKGKNLRRYISSHTLEEVETRSDTPIPFSVTKPSTPKSSNVERRMLSVILEDNQNVAKVHLLQALKHLIDTDPTVLPKLRDAYEKTLDLNLQYE